jgi:hypothetical protein
MSRSHWSAPLQWRSYRRHNTQSCVAPRPIGNFLNQACFDRVVFNIRNRRGEMALVSDVRVPVVVLPERPGPRQQAIRHSRRETLPRTDDVSQRMISKRFNEHVNVVRHHRPCKQSVSLAIEMKQGVLHHFAISGCFSQQLPSPASRKASRSASATGDDISLIFSIASAGRLSNRRNVTNCRVSGESKCGR